ncbi:hypothetical protein BJX76DRAFT_360635 [Aspergillus varians]
MSTISTITIASQATMPQSQAIPRSCRSYPGTESNQYASEHTPPRTCGPSLVDGPSQPDIEWNPSYQTFLERVERLAASAADRPTSLPDGFLPSIDAPRVWTGSDFEDSTKYVLEFSAKDIKEIERGLAYFKGLPGDLGPDDVSKETFPLPHLKATLQDVAHSLHLGHGFVVLRGLNPEKYSSLDNVFLYLGITSYVAETRGAQDYDGRMIVHVKDMEHNLPGGATRQSPYSSRAQPFHTDRCDILSMYALDIGATGGESLLASSGKVYNEIAATRPDIIHLLTNDNWVFDEFVTPPKWYTAPLLIPFGPSGPSFSFSRRPLTGAPSCPHTPGIPPMTEEQAEALDTVHFTAQKHQLCIPLQRGDIQILNNLALFHARRGFVDDDVRKRHLLRLWLRNEEMAWEIPAVLVGQAREVYGREGLDAEPKWDVNQTPPAGMHHMRCS